MVWRNTLRILNLVLQIPKILVPLIYILLFLIFADIVEAEELFLLNKLQLVLFKIFFLHFL